MTVIALCPWPFLAIFQIFGLISYRKSNGKIFRISEILSIYSVFCFSLLTHIRIEYCYFLKTRIDDFFTFVFVMLHSVGTHIVVIVEFFIILLKNRELCSMAAEMVILRESFKRPNNTKIIYLAWAIIALCCFQFFLYLYSSLVKNVSVLGECNWFFSTFNLYSLVIDVLILFYVGNIEVILFDINTELYAVSKQTYLFKIHSIKKIRNSHAGALNIIKNFNECFGPVTLISAFKEFVVFVCTIFYAMASPSVILGIPEYFVWFSRYFINYLAKLILFTLTYKQVRRKMYINVRTIKFY